MSNFQHLVGFKNDVNNKNSYYFDFTDNKWVKCSKIQSLPYNLSEYMIENSEQSFITCNDSYRLSDNLDDVLSNDEMYKESLDIFRSLSFPHSRVQSIS